MIPRGMWACLLAAILVLRLLTPAGFMPVFEGGRLTIVACPDASPAAPSPAHHHGDAGKTPHSCAYATASGLGSLTPDPVTLPEPLLLGAAMVLLSAWLFAARSRVPERPPSTGPPFAA